MTTTGKHAREGGSKTKKKLLAIAAAAMCCALMAGGTLAYFTAEERAHNVITSGGVDIELYEWADKPQGEVPFRDVSGVMPGDVVTKVVEVKNTGTNPAWVRVSAVQAVTLNDGTSLDEETFGKAISVDFNTDDWVLSEGWWYYKVILPAGEVTTPLFEHVSFDGPNMDNLYQKGTVTVNVSAQAVQSDNNPITDEAVGAPSVKGWPTSTPSGN